MLYLGMKPHWFSLKTMIMVAAMLTMSYLLSIILNVELGLILALYFSATIATLWMTVRILKDPYSTDKTFDEYFYADREDLRRNRMK